MLDSMTAYRCALRTTNETFCHAAMLCYQKGQQFG
jgi:hypothetical protein